MTAFRISFIYSGDHFCNIFMPE